MKNITVVGAGLMGHGIAAVFMLGGCEVTLHDVSGEVLSRAQEMIHNVVLTLVEAGAVAPGTERPIRCTTHLAAAVADAELIVEAVTEDEGVKRGVFTQLDASAPPTAIWASNTSSLNVFPLIPERRQANSLIAHWYTPPYIVELVDVVPGPATRPPCVEAVRSLLTSVGKKPIVMAKFISGYIANRLQAALNLEVFFLLDQGYATPEQIDEAAKSGLALRLPFLGLLKKMDYTGLELIQQLLANKSYEPPRAVDGSKVLDGLIESGHKGVMVGKGFFNYQGHSPQELFRERDKKLLALRKFLAELGDIG